MEDARAQVKAAALRILETTGVAQAACARHGWDMPSFVLRGIADPTAVAAYPEVAAASDAQRALRDLTADLMRQHNLDFHLVRSVYAPILNPSESEQRLCKEALERCRLESLIVEGDSIAP